MNKYKSKYRHCLGIAIMKMKVQKPTPSIKGLYHLMLIISIRINR